MTTLLKIKTKILGRIAFLGILAVLSIWIYNQYIWPLDRKEHAYFLEELTHSRDTCDLIYIGESSNMWYHPDSGDAREISKMIEHRTNRKVLNLSKSAYHIGIYQTIFEHFETLNTLRDVVLTVNLRTFGPPCVHSKLETSLQKDRIFYANEMPFIKKMRAVFSLYDNTDEKTRDRKMWEHWTYDTLNLAQKRMKYYTVKNWCSVPKFLDSAGIENMNKRILADHYVKAYGFNITENNPRIKDLDALTSRVDTSRYNLHLLILSENTQWADSLAGEELADLMRENRDFIVQRYSNKYTNVHIIDNLETVPPRYFGEKQWTTEHYFWQGRSMIANSVINHLKAINHYER